MSNTVRITDVTGIPNTSPISSGNQAAMHDDPIALAGCSRPSHFRQVTALRDDLPELAGGSVTENGLRPAGKNSCHPSAVNREQPVPDGVHASMHQVKLASFDASIDSASLNAPVEKLPSRHEPVLLLGQLSNQPISPHPPPSLP